jgi:hypothetical protein
LRRVALPGGEGLVREPGDPEDPNPHTSTAVEVQAEVEAVQWAEVKHVKEDADAEDTTVQQLIADVQTTKAAVKAAPSGALTLTKSQHLTIVRGLLYVLKGDKAA